MIKKPARVRPAATQPSARQQINIRIDDEFMQAVDALRRATVPVSTASDAIRAAVIAQAAMLAGAARRR